MNDLTREASKRAILEAISFLWLGARGRRRKSHRGPQKPLKGRPEHILTSLEPYYKQSGKHADIKPQPLHT